MKTAQDAAALANLLCDTGWCRVETESKNGQAVTTVILRDEA